MKTLSMDLLRDRIEQLDSIPSIPAILLPLLRCLDEPSEHVDVQRIIDLISHDKSLSAQVLHMANSPLFGRWQAVQSVRGAVLALGTSRVRDIATACCLLKLMAKAKGLIDPRFYWEHSLSCALVSRRLARKIGYEDPESAYLAGLLHDIGIIVNLLVIPEEFHQAAELAFTERMCLEDAERKTLGFTHSFTGELLAEHWKLGQHLQAAIRRHHDVQMATAHHTLISIVSVSDLLCRMRGMGYGYIENRQVEFTSEPAWEVLANASAALRRMDFERFTFELDDYVKEVRQLVSVLFRFQ